MESRFYLLHRHSSESFLNVIIKVKFKINPEKFPWTISGPIIFKNARFKNYWMSSSSLKRCLEIYGHICVNMEGKTFYLLEVIQEAFWILISRCAELLVKNHHPKSNLHKTKLNPKSDFKQLNSSWKRATVDITNLPNTIHFSSFDTSRYRGSRLAKSGQIRRVFARWGGIARRRRRRLGWLRVRVSCKESDPLPRRAITHRGDEQTSCWVPSAFICRRKRFWHGNAKPIKRANETHFILPNRTR